MEGGRWGKLVFLLLLVRYRVAETFLVDLV